MTARWICAGARAIGTSHVKQGLPCQDAFRTTVWSCPGEPPILIAALADGAGSAALAGSGAEFAASFVIDLLFRAFEGGAAIAGGEAILREAVIGARRALEAKAAYDGHAIEDFASTLLVAIVSSGGGVFGQIGDGAIVIDDAEVGWRPVHWPDHGEYANTTRFLTESDAPAALQIAVTDKPPRRLALFSDGLERLVLDFRSRTAHAPFFDAILSRLISSRGEGHEAEVSAEIEALLSTAQVNARTDDDKALVCAALIEA